MIEIKRILCPVDFSGFSRRALNYSVALARWYDARVTVLHVHPDVPAVDIIPSLAAEPARRIMLNEIERTGLLDAERALVRDAKPGRVPVDVTLEEGRDPRRAILEHASALNADLIVMGTHGRAGYERLLLGSIAEHVLRKASCPVMVVPRGAEHPVPFGDVAFNRILCGVDFSECSLAALEYALSLAEEADAQVTILNVVERRTDVDALPAPVALTLHQMNAEEDRACLARLHALVPERIVPYCTVRTAVTAGRAWSEIARLAADDEDDLIVIGAHGSGALDRMLFGSTTHRVLQASPCPVLTVRG